jgi:hypothetical protein
MSSATDPPASISKGSRNGDIEKDSYKRLLCADCGTRLARRTVPDEPWTLRRCPECDRQWRDL